MNLEEFVNNKTMRTLSRYFNSLQKSNGPQRIPSLLVINRYFICVILIYVVAIHEKSFFQREMTSMVKKVKLGRIFMCMSIGLSLACANVVVPLQTTHAVFDCEEIEDVDFEESTHVNFSWEGTCADRIMAAVKKVMGTINL